VPTQHINDLVTPAETTGMSTRAAGPKRAEASRWDVQEWRDC